MDDSEEWSRRPRRREDRKPEKPESLAFVVCLILCAWITLDGSFDVARSIWHALVGLARLIGNA